MKHLRLNFRAALIAVTLGTAAHASGIRFSSDFPAGSIGNIYPTSGQGGTVWHLALRSDNNDESLPASFRAWWYVRADEVPTDKPTQLIFERIGWNYDFRPIFSYDNIHWQYFSDEEAVFDTGCKPSSQIGCSITLTKTFAQPRVWIARTFPYTHTDLTRYLDTLRGNPYVKQEVIGISPVLGKPVYALTITDQAHNSATATVVIHARTHAAETGPSLVLEGLINTLISENPLAKDLRAKYVFKIVPMHNIDGAERGNYRTNPNSVDLESQWRFDRSSPSPVYLTHDSPKENLLLNQSVFAGALIDPVRPTVLALNLHASNSAPNTMAFFFPHFGSDPMRYTPSQIELWKKQLAFVGLVAANYDGRIEQPPSEGGDGFLKTFFPETWWWYNNLALPRPGGATNAMTLETTYSKAGFDHWIEPNDLRDLGRALAVAIHDMDKPTPRLFRFDSLFRAPFHPEVYQHGEEH